MDGNEYAQEVEREHNSSTRMHSGEDAKEYVELNEDHDSAPGHDLRNLPLVKTKRTPTKKLSWMILLCLKRHH